MPIPLVLDRKNLDAVDEYGEAVPQWNLMSHLHGPQSIGKGITGFLNPRNKARLREVSAVAHDVGMEHDRGSKELVIKGSLRAWRAAVPNARYANISGRKDITDDDFQYLEGLEYLNMSHCSQETITDAAFVHLRGIHTLNMSDCDQETITDAAFVHLKGIHTLDITSCDQPTITDNAFAHLHGIHMLKMVACTQLTDAAFVHLRGIHTLYMRKCPQETITDAAFVNLRGIHTLDMRFCDQESITDAAFTNLQGIHKLYIGYCDQRTITGRTLNILGNNLRILYIKRCNLDTCRNAYDYFGVSPTNSEVTKHPPTASIASGTSARSRLERELYEFPNIYRNFESRLARISRPRGGYRSTKRKQRKSRKTTRR